MRSLITHAQRNGFCLNKHRSLFVFHARDKTLTRPSHVSFSELESEPSGSGYVSFCTTEHVNRGSGSCAMKDHM